jgi:hypothetical protein
MLENYDSAHLSGAQLRKIVKLADGLVSADDQNVSERITVAERPIFQHDDDVVYVSIFRWVGSGHNRRVEAYLAKDGSEIVGKAEGTT